MQYQFPLTTDARRGEWTRDQRIVEAVVDAFQVARLHKAMTPSNAKIAVKCIAHSISDLPCESVKTGTLVRLLVAELEDRVDVHHAYRAAHTMAWRLVFDLFGGPA